MILEKNGHLRGGNLSNFGIMLRCRVMGHLEMVTRVLLQAPSPAPSLDSSCDQEGGCVSDYVAMGVTAFVALM